MHNLYWSNSSNNSSVLNSNHIAIHLFIFLILTYIYSRLYSTTPPRIDFNLQKMKYYLPKLYWNAKRAMKSSSQDTTTSNSNVLAFSIILFHASLSLAIFRIFTFIFFKSLITSSSHLTFGLPTVLFPIGFHAYIFFC